jgi:hypothetical protein
LPLQQRHKISERLARVTAGNGRHIGRDRHAAFYHLLKSLRKMFTDFAKIETNISEVLFFRRAFRRLQYSLYVLLQIVFDKLFSAHFAERFAQQA